MMTAWTAERVAARRGTFALINGMAAAAFSLFAISGSGEHADRDPFYFFLWRRAERA